MTNPLGRSMANPPATLNNGATIGPWVIQELFYQIEKLVEKLIGRKLGSLAITLGS